MFLKTRNQQQNLPFLLSIAAPLKQEFKLPIKDFAVAAEKRDQSVDNVTQWNNVTRDLINSFSFASFCCQLFAFLCRNFGSFFFLSQQQKFLLRFSPIKLALNPLNTEKKEYLKISEVKECAKGGGGGLRT